MCLYLIVILYKANANHLLALAPICIDMRDIMPALLYGYD